jgi:hypothetical protein
MPSFAKAHTTGPGRHYRRCLLPSLDNGTILASTQQGADYLLLPEHGHDHANDAAEPQSVDQ